MKSCGFRWASVLVLLASQAMAGAIAGAQSDRRPFWTEQAMFRFGHELYFVGVSSCAMTSEAGRAAAFESGMKELKAYARDRETSRLFVETAMIYEEPNPANCRKGGTSVWRLLRVNQAMILELPRQEVTAQSTEAKQTHQQTDSSDAVANGVPHAPVQDLTPRPGMSRDHIAQRFGKPTKVTKHGQEEIWGYGDSGLTITFSPNETLVSWTLAGIPNLPFEETRASLREKETSERKSPPRPPASEEFLAEEPAKPVAPQTPIPLTRNPVEEGRTLFNGKGACHTCHGRDADMHTDVRQEMLYGVAPGYIPPVITAFGPSPSRVPPNLRDWFSLRIRTDLELYRAIKQGIGGSTMTGTRHLTDGEISDLIAYLNSLR